MADPNPRVIADDDAARAHVNAAADSRWQDQMPQVPVVLVALAMLVRSLEARVAELERES